MPTTVNENLPTISWKTSGFDASGVLKEYEIRSRTNGQFQFIEGETLLNTSKFAIPVNYFRSGPSLISTIEQFGHCFQRWTNIQMPREKGVHLYDLRMFVTNEVLDGYQNTYCVLADATDKKVEVYPEKLTLEKKMHRLNFQMPDVAKCFFGKLFHPNTPTPRTLGWEEYPEQSYNWQRDDEKSEIGIVRKYLRDGSILYKDSVALSARSCLYLDTNEMARTNNGEPCWAIAQIIKRTIRENTKIIGYIIDREGLGAHFSDPYDVSRATRDRIAAGNTNNPFTILEGMHGPIDIPPRIIGGDTEVRNFLKVQEKTNLFSFMPLDQDGHPVDLSRISDYDIAQHMKNISLKFNGPNGIVMAAYKDGDVTVSRKTDKFNGLYFPTVTMKLHLSISDKIIQSVKACMRAQTDEIPLSEEESATLVDAFRSRNRAFLSQELDMRAWSEENRLSTMQKSQLSANEIQILLDAKLAKDQKAKLTRIEEVILYANDIYTGPIQQAILDPTNCTEDEKMMAWQQLNMAAARGSDATFKITVNKEFGEVVTDNSIHIGFRIRNQLCPSQPADRHSPNLELGSADRLSPDLELAFPEPASR
ncbi:MAG: hypothetical protein HW387_1179 [Parachlamydiales bacterium]|nr:hypothetical protein [Parachlamydiales bacterium]